MDKNYEGQSLLTPKVSKSHVSKTPNCFHEKTKSFRSFEFSDNSIQNSKSQSIIKTQSPFLKPTGIKELSNEINGIYEFRATCFDKIKSLETVIERNKATHEQEISYMQEYINLLKRKLGGFKSSHNSSVEEPFCENCKEKNKMNYTLTIEIEELKVMIKDIEYQNQLYLTEIYNKKKEISELNITINNTQKQQDVLLIISELEKQKDVYEKLNKELQNENQQLYFQLQDKDNEIFRIQMRLNQAEQGLNTISKNLESLIRMTVYSSELSINKILDKTEDLDGQLRKLKKIVVNLKDKNSQQPKHSEWINIPSKDSPKKLPYSASYKKNVNSANNLKNLAEENEFLNEKVSLMLEEHANSIEAIEIMHEENELSIKKILKLKEENESNVAKVYDLEEKNNKLNELIRKFNDEKKIFNEKFRTVSEENAKKNRENYKLREDFIVLQEKNQILKETIRELETQKLHSDQEVVKISKELENLNKDTSNYKQEIQLLNYEIQKLSQETKDVKKLQKTIEGKLKEDLKNKLNEEKNAYNQNIKTLQDRNNSLVTEIEELTLKLQRAQKDVSSVNHKLTAAYDECEASDKAVKSLERECEAFNESNQKALKSNIDLNEKIQNLILEKTELQHQNENLSKQISSLVEGNLKNNDLAEELIEKNYELESLQKGVQEIHDKCIECKFYQDFDVTDQLSYSDSDNEIRDFDIESDNKTNSKYLTIIRNLLSKLEKIAENGQNREKISKNLKKQLRKPPPGGSTDEYQQIVQKDSENTLRISELTQIIQEKENTISDLSENLNKALKELYDQQKYIEDLNNQLKTESYKDPEKIKNQIEHLENESISIESRSKDIQTDDLRPSIKFEISQTEMVDYYNQPTERTIRKIESEKNYLEEPVSRPGWNNIVIEDSCEKVRDIVSTRKSTEEAEKYESQFLDKDNTLTNKIKFLNDCIKELENKNSDLEMRYNRIRDKNVSLESSTKKYSVNVEKVFKDLNKKLQTVEKKLKTAESRIQFISNDYNSFRSKYITSFQEKTRLYIQSLSNKSSSNVFLDKDETFKLMQQKIEFLENKINSLVESNYITREMIETISDKAHDAIELIRIV